MNAYERGFMEKCAEYGVDPTELTKHAQRDRRDLNSVPTGQGPQNTRKAIELYEQARTLVRPSDEFLKLRNLSRKDFSSGLDRWLDTSEGNLLRPRKAYPTNIPDVAIPSTAAAGGIFGALAAPKGARMGGGLGGATAGLLASLGLKLRNDSVRRKLERVHSTINEYGALNPNTLRRLRPLIDDKHLTKSSQVSDRPDIISNRIRREAASGAGIGSTVGAMLGSLRGLDPNLQYKLFPRWALYNPKAKATRLANSLIRSLVSSGMGAAGGAFAGTALGGGAGAVTGSLLGNLAANKAGIANKADKLQNIEQSYE